MATEFLLYANPATHGGPDCAPPVLLRMGADFLVWGQATTVRQPIRFATAAEAEAVVARLSSAKSAYVVPMEVETDARGDVVDLKPHALGVPWQSPGRDFGRLTKVLGTREPFDETARVR